MLISAFLACDTAVLNPIRQDKWVYGPASNQQCLVSIIAYAQPLRHSKEAQPIAEIAKEVTCTGPMRIGLEGDWYQGHR